MRKGPANAGPFVLGKLRLFADWRAADLVVFQYAAGVADFELRDRLAFFHRDQNAVVCGMGGGGAQQGRDQEAVQKFGGGGHDLLLPYCVFDVANVRFGPLSPRRTNAAGRVRNSR